MQNNVQFGTLERVIWKESSGKKQILTQGIESIFSVCTNNGTKLSGFYEYCGTLPRPVDHLQAVMGFGCTFPLFDNVLVLEGWPGARDREMSFIPAAPSFTAHNQPCIKSNWLSKSGLFLSGTNDSREIEGNCTICVSTTVSQFEDLEKQARPKKTNISHYFQLAFDFGKS